MTEGVKSEESRRRLAEALRENLKRRKAQARGRAIQADDGAAEAQEGTPPDDRPRRATPSREQ